jgi:hypothetical protein
MSERTAAASVGQKSRIEIKRTLNRLDFIVQPRMDALQELIPPLIQDAVAQLKTFVDVTNEWVRGQAVPVTRIAIGCGAMLEADGVVPAYTKVAALLPLLKIDPLLHRDLQLRLNSPVRSVSMEELPINVLGTWSVLFMSLGMGDPRVAGNFSNTRHFVQCAVDVNTDAHRTAPIPAANLDALFSELFGLTLGLLNEGAK